MSRQIIDIRSDSSSSTEDNGIDNEEQIKQIDLMETSIIQFPASEGYASNETNNDTPANHSSIENHLPSTSFSTSSKNTSAKATAPAHSEHLGKSRQYWRDIILGVNDGLVSTFLLVAGVSGGKLSVSNILLTAISGAVAGSISMAAGEFVATKSQDEVLRGEIALEHKHIRDYRRDEMSELDELLGRIGITPAEEVRDKVLKFYESNDDALLKVMIALEFGAIEEERRSPVKAGIFSFVLFLVGSLPSVLPFAVVDDSLMGLIVAGVVTGISLLIVGAVKSCATRGNCVVAAMENLLIAGVGGALAYGIGVLFDSLI